MGSNPTHDKNVACIEGFVPGVASTVGKNVKSKL